MPSFAWFFSSSGLMPHGFCYQWQPSLIWLHAVSDTLIALAYFSIPSLLFYFVRKRRDLPFDWMFVFFGTFIAACGATHLMDVWTLWVPVYWFSGGVKVLTALASLPTAALLLRVVPKALTLPSPEEVRKANGELRSREVVLREQTALLDLSQDAILVRDLFGRIRFWSHGAERMYGWSKSEAIGQTEEQLLKWKSPLPPSDILTMLFASGYWAGEFLHQRRDDQTITVSTRWALQRDSSGTPVGILETNTDVTEQRRVEDALRNSEDLYRDLVEHSQDLICTHNPNGILLSVNEAPTKILGYSRVELLNKPLRDFVVPEARATCDEYLAKIQRDGFAKGLLPVLTKNGQVRLWEYNNTLRRDRVGAPIVRGMAHDVTDQTLVEKALRASEEKFRMMAENIQEIFWMIDPKTKDLVYVSPAYERIWGRTMESIATNPMSYQDAIHAEDRAAVIGKLARLENADHLAAEYRIVWPDGTVKWMQSRGSPARDAQGRITALVGTTQDITARKQAEEALRQAQKMEAIALLAGGIAHDFNNILAGVLGYAEFLQKSINEQDPRRQRLDAIVAASLQGRDLTRQLLAFGRSQAQPLSPLNLSAQIAEMENMLRRLIEERIQVEFDLASDADNILADPSFLQQIVMNLAINARDAMDEGGKLKIRTAIENLTSEKDTGQADIPDGRYFVLEVHDTGRGMSHSVQERMFEPFFTTKGAGRGSGLGLYTVYRIVQRCSGHIRVLSEQLRGTSVQIYFPVTQEQLILEAVLGSTDEGVKPGQLVLLVEDDARVREAVRDQLIDLGYDVACESSPVEALLSFETIADEVQLLLTDIVMPELNGMELAQRLQALQPRLKVLYMTGYAGRQVMSQDMLKEGANLIHKPFTRQELAAKIRQILQGSSSAASDEEQTIR